MSETPACPYCGGKTHYAKRKSFDLSMGETPIACENDCGGDGTVGYRDHDYGDTYMDRPEKTK